MVKTQTRAVFVAGERLAEPLEPVWIRGKQSPVIIHRASIRSGVRPGLHLRVLLVTVQSQATLKKMRQTQSGYLRVMAYAIATTTMGDKRGDIVPNASCNLAHVE
jgi:hypothetical protein